MHFLDTVMTAVTQDVYKVQITMVALPCSSDPHHILFIPRHERHLVVARQRGTAVSHLCVREVYIMFHSSYGQAIKNTVITDMEI